MCIFQRKKKNGKQEKKNPFKSVVDIKAAAQMLSSKGRRTKRIRRQGPDCDPLFRQYRRHERGRERERKHTQKHTVLKKTMQIVFFFASTNPLPPSFFFSPWSCSSPKKNEGILRRVMEKEAEKEGSRAKMSAKSHFDCNRPQAPFETVQGRGWVGCACERKKRG